LTDQELVILIQQNQDYLGEVYKRCKKNSLFYLRRNATNSINNEVLEDIFQDAIIALYENILKNRLDLKVKIQTYIDKVCYNMLLKYIKENKPDIIVPINDDGFIADILEPIENSKEPKYIALEKALEKMKLDKGHCYELISQFWYHQKNMNVLTEVFGYSSSDNTKHQKARCQERLRKLAFNELNNK
jgi:hypothetical protein